VNRYAIIISRHLAFNIRHTTDFLSKIIPYSQNVSIFNAKLTRFLTIF